jgi:hypothetical protein
MNKGHTLGTATSNPLNSKTESNNGSKRRSASAPRNQSVGKSDKKGTLENEDVKTKRIEALDRHKSEATNKKNAPLALRAFTKGASVAQLSQLKMIQDVFSVMDADNDGILSVNDVKSYFSSINRNASDAVVRKWIRERDIDQDGAVSLVEFVSSFAHQLDPSSGDGNKKRDIACDTSANVSNVTSAFGLLRIGCSPLEVANAISAVEEYVQRVLDSPSTQSFWRIPINDMEFHKRIGRLLGGVKLMLSLGFSLEDNGTVLALRDASGSKWEAVPADIRSSLSTRIEELWKHKASLLEPTVSNVAAGTANLNIIYMTEFN